MHRRACSAGVLAIPMLAAAAARAGGVPMRFTNATAGLGIEHRYTAPGHGVFVSPMIAGIAAGDFNRDGLDDLFILGGGSAPDQLLIASMADGHLAYTDQAAAWGVDRRHIGAGVSVADYNNDGYPDVYVTSQGTPIARQAGRHTLYRNTGPRADGSFAFEDVAEQAGVARTSPSAPTAFPAPGAISTSTATSISSSRAGFPPRAATGFSRTTATAPWTTSPPKHCPPRS